MRAPLWILASSLTTVACTRHEIGTVARLKASSTLQLIRTTVANEAPKPSPSIRGQVLEQASGQAIAGACLTLSAETRRRASTTKHGDAHKRVRSHRAFASIVVHSDANGNYEIKLPHTGARSVSARLVVRHKDYAENTLPVTWTGRESQDLKPVMLSHGCRVHGTVVDARGRESWFDDIVLRKEGTDSIGRPSLSEVVVVTKGGGKFRTPYPLAPGVWTVSVVSDALKRPIALQRGSRLVLDATERSRQHRVVVDSLAENASSK